MRLGEGTGSFGKGGRTLSALRGKKYWKIEEKF